MAILTVCSDLQTHNLMPSKRVPNEDENRRGPPTKQFFPTFLLTQLNFYCDFRNHKEMAHRTIFFYIFKPVSGLTFFERFLTNTPFFPPLTRGLRVKCRLTVYSCDCAWGGDGKLVNATSHNTR